MQRSFGSVMASMAKRTTQAGCAISAERHRIDPKARALVDDRRARIERIVP